MAMANLVEVQAILDMDGGFRYTCPRLSVLLVV